MNVSRLIEFFLLWGVCIWQYPALYSLYAAVRGRAAVRRDLRRYTDGGRLKGTTKLENYIGKVIEGAAARNFFPRTEDFFYFSGILFLAGFFIPYMIVDLKTALLCGMFSGLLPYGALAARLHERRGARSREGGVLVQELLNNYKICSYNMKEAVEATAGSIEDAPNARKVMLDLAKGLNYAVTKPEVNDILESFRFSFNTSWANVLSVDIFFAHIYGIRVDYALGDLLSCMVRSRKISEHEKRENNEARLMLKYLAPVSYILTVLCAVKYFGYTLGKFIKYQFATAMGLRWFILMVIFYSAGLMLNAFLAKGKMDI